MKELIERMAKALVDSPEEVVVKEIQRHNLTVVELSVAKSLSVNSYDLAKDDKCTR